MTRRWGRVPLLVLVAGLAAAVVVGCSDLAGPQPTAAPTPMTVLSPMIDAARAAVSARLTDAGFILEQQTFGYQPGEPGSLQTVPNAVFRVNLIDTGQGWVVIYDLGSTGAAVQAATDFADYLRSFGHSNYPGDAQFTLNVVDGALIFHWWSAERSSDPDRARAAFAVIAGIGQPIEIGN
jgi:hypothetical protein